MKYEELLYKYRLQISTFLIGVILICFGVAAFFARDSENTLVVDEQEESTSQRGLVVEISGAVSKPGVYELPSDARVDELINIAGGFKDENKDWVSRFINKAALLKDGQKIYIPSLDEQSYLDSASNSQGYQGTSEGSVIGTSGVININTATQSELESLNGIGPVYAKKIIEHRPYSDIAELTSKNVVGDALFEKIKDSISVF